MWGPVFCIDLGAGYTKVAIRTDAESPAVLLVPENPIGVDAFCVPSLVAVFYDASNKPSLLCGRDAAALNKTLDPDRQPRERFEVFENWKKEVFEYRPDQPAGLSALLESPEFAGLAGRYQVPLSQVQHLKQLVQAAHALGGTPAPAGESLKLRQLRAKAETYFGHVRRFVLAECARRFPSLPDAATIPTVLAVPAFTLEADLKELPAVQLLLQALGKAGWVPHPIRPVVSEPLANLVGVLTAGNNALVRRPAIRSRPATVDIDVGRMFSQGPLLTAINDPTHYPLYRGLVVDVGAYTTDIAIIELPTDDPDGVTVDSFRIRQTSVPLGVMELDRRVMNVLPTAQGAHMAKMSFADKEEFRPRVYSERKAWRTLEMTIPGRGDSAIVGGVIQGFADEIAKHVCEFCQGLQAASMQEIVITGGGGRIPAVKTAIETVAALPGNPVVTVYSPKRVTAIVDANARLLGNAVRGGTAMGGVSTYFSRTSPELAQPVSSK